MQYRLLYLRFKPTRKCEPSGLEGRKSNSPKNSKAPFSDSNSQPINLLLSLSKLLGKIVLDQIQCYFTVNKLTTDFQHTYREEHSTSTALSQSSVTCVREIDTIIVGAVLLNLSAAFDILDHSLLLEKHMCYCLSNRTKRVLFHGSLSNIIQLESGIPQGTCLGPLLFSIFNNITCHWH